MKNPRKFLTRCSIAAAALFLLAGCGPEADYAYVTNGVDPFWTIAEAGAKKAGADLGVNVTVLMPASGAEEQKSMLEDLISRGVKGIAVSPIDAANQTDLLDQIAENTILVTHDSDAPDSKRRAYIGMDNYDAGRACGQLVKEALPEGGSIMILVGRMEQDNAQLRRQGVIDELLDRSHDNSRRDPLGGEITGEKFTILGTLTDQFDAEAAKTNAEDTLARNPDISAMVGLFAYNPPLILEALESAGKVGNVKVIAFDEDSRTLQAITDGRIHGTVVQNPYLYGYKSIEVLKALHEGKSDAVPADGFINVEARQIRKDNVQAFWADLKQKLGEE